MISDFHPYDDIKVLKNPDRAKLGMFGKDNRYVAILSPIAFFGALYK
jgi:hypothetical protein